MPKYTRNEFMAEFDINETDVAAASERIDAYVQGWNLAQMRKDAGMTQVELAKALGVNQSRISAIEHGDPDSMTLATTRAYVEALGGRLRLAAEFGDHQIQFPAVVQRDKRTAKGLKVDIAKAPKKQKAPASSRRSKAKDSALAS